MRGVLLSLVCAAGLLAATPATPAAFGSATAAISAPAAPAVLALQQADKTIDININGGGGHWYRSPVWIAIGALAVVVILLLLIVAVRGGGGGTTIVKD